MALDGMRLEGRRCVVTGAGRGLGRAIALELARRGARVLCAARTAAEIDDTANACSASTPGSLAQVCDVTDRTQCEALIARAIEAFGGIDLLVNNAGIAHYGPVDALDEGQLDAMWAVNVKGVAWCSRAAYAAMREAGAGLIVTIASIAGKLGLPGESGYCASKFAAVGFTRALAAEARPHGVRATVVCPGGINTPFWDSVTDNRPDVSLFLDPADVARLVADLVDTPDGCLVDEVVLRPARDRH